MFQIEGAPPPCGDGVGISPLLKKYKVTSPGWGWTHLVMLPRSGWTYSVMSRGLGCKVMVMSPPHPHRGVGHLKFEGHITVTYLNHTLHFTHYSGHCSTHMITVIWSRKCANLSLLAAYSGNGKFFLFGSNIITKG